LKKAGIYIFLILALLIGGKYIFKKQEKKEITMLLLKGENEKLKSIVNEYSIQNKIEINIKETDFFDFVSGIEEKHRKNEEIADIFIVINDWIGELAEKDIIEELNIEPFYIKVSKYRIVIECLSLVNDSIIDFDKLGFEYCANMLKKYAMDFDCRVN